MLCINFVESRRVLAILKKTTICLFHPVSNGCIVKKIIVLSSQYYVIVEAAKIHVLRFAPTVCNHTNQSDFLSFHLQNFIPLMSLMTIS